jgi:hypothetical protein
MEQYQIKYACALLFFWKRGNAILALPLQLP